MTYQRMAVVDGSGNVVNVIVYDPEATWSPPDGCRLIEDKRGLASPGGTWDGKTFIVPIEKLRPAWWQKQ